MRFILAFLALSSILTLTQKAQAAHTDDCVNITFVDSFETVDQDTLRLHDGAKTSDMKFLNCPELPFAQGLHFESVGPWACPGDAVVLTDFTGQYLDRCWIDSITQN